MRCAPLLTLVATGLMLGACADFYSIGRTRVLPDNPTSNKGLAIHLDAQQRLMMVGKDGTYCAEASPDAMAAYAAALAASASAQGYGAGSASNASQSNIASIGLRTQSITLMRDALYRLCEAGANGQLSKMSATQLMARSQDLTAVVVAVEQLTGAVAANQAFLTGTANASGSASMMSNDALAARARKTVETRQQQLQQAQEAQKKQAEVVRKQDEKATTARSNFDAAEQQNPQPANLEELREAATREADKLTAEKANLEIANDRVANADANLTEARSTLATVEATNSTALAQSQAGTSGEGAFSTPVPRIQLSKEATAEVAKSVQAMVTTVVGKDYTAADCMFLLTNVTNLGELSELQRKLLDTTLAQCTTLLNAKIAAVTTQYVTATYLQPSTDPTADVNRIRAAIDKNPALEDRMNDHLASRNLNVGDVLTRSELAAVAQELIRTFNIP